MLDSQRPRAGCLAFIMRWSKTCAPTLGSPNRLPPADQYHHSPMSRLVVYSFPSYNTPPCQALMPFSIRLFRSGIPRRRTDMKFKLVFALFLLLSLGTPIYAQIDQSLCVQRLKAAQEELKKCLDEAISHEDKTSCAERQVVRTKTCEDGECKIERGGGKW